MSLDSSLLTTTLAEIDIQIQGQCMLRFVRQEADMLIGKASCTNPALYDCTHSSMHEHSTLNALLPCTMLFIDAADR